MLQYLSVVAVLLVGVGAAPAHGLLIPAEKTIPPLAMLNHQVNVAIEDQVVVTRVEQTFRNHTDRNLEATYVFPVPKGASLRKFTMWVDGKEVAGELVEAGKARQVYTEIVRRTQDPGLLEYVGNNLLRLRIFPVPAHGDQKVALSYTSVAPRDAGLVEYIYPLKTDGKATRTLENFSLQATIKSQHPIQNVYSPTHAISLSRPHDHEVAVTFERDQALLDKDFQLFYAVGDQDVGLTVLTQRPLSGENGYVMLLLSPRVQMSQSQRVPRDMVLVLDTSGSMRGPKMDQARRALKYCLANLAEQDRFGLIHFATTVNKYRDGLLEASKEQVDHARKWVDTLEATGGTAIDDALKAALEMRASNASRTFTVVFFTDGCPTIGETNPDKILHNVAGRNTTSTRIFTFGVGDDVNATMLDQLAEQTRAVSTYVRPAEDIEVKVSSLYGKISHPVLANLQLTTGNNVSFSEIYPPQLPDLFQGGQVVVLGRYTGQGPAAVTLTGQIGAEKKDYVFETTFPAKTTEDRSFVEHLWARRKVGYLLDQIRANGEKKELVEETVLLAKKYSIATPYTSYLVVPDAPVPVAGFGGRGGSPRDWAAPEIREAPLGLGGLKPTAAGPLGGPGQPPQKVAIFARQVQSNAGDLAKNRDRLEEERFRRLGAAIDAKGGKGRGGVENGQGRGLQEAQEKKQVYDEARKALLRRDKDGVQSGKLGVDLSIQTNYLRNQARLELTAQKNVNGRNCLELGGVWIDEGFDAKMKTVIVKAMSDAYFRILERQPKMKSVFQLGNHLVWVAPNGSALVIDTNDGKEQLSDADIDGLFVAKTK